MPSLAPGEHTTITLALNSAADLPLTRYDGSIYIAGLAGNLTVPFRFRALSTRQAATNGPTRYKVGGTLKYIDGGVLLRVPLAYFLQRDVSGDDPFTDEIDPSEPFSLGLLVKNTGMSAAQNFTFTSAPPKIIDNEKGLLIDFKIIGTQVGNLPSTPSLTANVS